MSLIFTSGHDPGDEDAGVLLLVLVEAAVDEGEAKTSRASLDGDGPRPELDNHPDQLILVTVGSSNLERKEIRRLKP